MFLGMSSNKIVGRHIHKLVQVMYLYHFFFFFSDFEYRSKGLMFYMIFFLGSGGDDPRHVGVPEPQGEGCVSGVQGRGSRGREC